jgi:conjugal transfer ATP-binding protein TraC
MLAKLGKSLFKALGEEEGRELSTSSFEEDWQAMAKVCQHKIGNLFPYDSFVEKYELFINDSTIGFVIETQSLVGSDEKMQKEISTLFENDLPEGSSLQVMQCADPHIGDLCDAYKESRSNQSPTLQEIVLRRSDFFKGLAFNSDFAPVRNFRCILSFTCPFDAKNLSNPVALEAISRLKEQICTTLEMLRLHPRVWRPTDLLTTLKGILFLDPTTTQIPHQKWNPHQRIAEQLSDSEVALNVSQDALSIRGGDVCIRSYTVTGFPQEWSLYAMNTLIGDEERDQGQIPCPFILHYGIHVPFQDKLKTQILAKSSYVDKQAYSPIGKYLPSIQREAAELSFVREELGKNARIVQTQFSVILLSSKEKLPKADKILTNLFGGKEWRLKRNRFTQLPSFLSCLPMMWGTETVRSLSSSQMLKTTLSTESCNLLPLQGEWMGTKTPGMMLGGRRGQLMNWHPFDNTEGNYNVCVVGRSGSGKSVFMQELVASTLGLGGRVFVLDVGRSFEKTCFLLEGQFIEFSTKTHLCINPFSTISMDNKEATEDSLAMLKPVVMLMAAPSQGVDDMGAALIEQAIIAAWNQHKNTANLTHVAAWLLGHADKKAQDLGTMLFPYTEKGSYGRYFTGPATVNLESSLVVVELEELKERKDLQAVVVQMMIINITNKMFLGDRTMPFNIVFDEAWDMLRGNTSGVFIETLARRLRKYRGSLVVGTQSVNDFFVNPGAQAAFDNSDWLCLLSQKPESIEQLKKANRIHVTPVKEAQLKSLRTKQGQYAEVMITGSSGYAIGRLLLDPYSSMLYSTKAEDYAAVQSLKAKGLSIKQAIEKVLLDRKEQS